MLETVWERREQYFQGEDVLRTVKTATFEIFRQKKSRRRKKISRRNAESFLNMNQK